MHAYVSYVQDAVRAIVPVTLVRDFRPRSDTDFDSSTIRKVYWYSEKDRYTKKKQSTKKGGPTKQNGCSRKEDESDGEFYEAKILDLADSKAALILKLMNRMLPIPRVFESDEDYLPPDTKDGRGKQTGCVSDGSISSDDSVVPSNLLAEKDRTIARLRKRLREEQEQNRRLTLALLDKIEVAREAAADQKPVPVIENSTAMEVAITIVPPVEVMTPVANMRTVNEYNAAREPATVLQAFEVPEDTNVQTGNKNFAVMEAATACSRAMLQAGSTSSAGPWQTTTSQQPLYALVEGKLHLGNDCYIPIDKFTFIQRGTTDSKLVKDLAKHFWTAEEMQVRSVTGQPCRRPGVTGAIKHQATPDKLEAIKNGLSKYIDGHPTEVPKDTRLKTVRKTLSDFFADVARYGKRRRKTTVE